MKPIYTDNNGLFVRAVETSSDGADVSGHQYTVGHLVPLQTIDFQNGPVPVHGVNGVTNESLLAILIHRTTLLDSKFGCDENKRAIGHMQEALAAFESRTANRMARGVEGQNLA